MNRIVPVDGGEVSHPDVHPTARRHRQHVSVRTCEQRRVEAAPIHTLIGIYKCVSRCLTKDDSIDNCRYLNKKKRYGILGDTAGVSTHQSTAQNFP